MVTKIRQLSRFNDPLLPNAMLSVGRSLVRRMTKSTIISDPKMNYRMIRSVQSRRYQYAAIRQRQQQNHPTTQHNVRSFATTTSSPDVAGTSTTTTTLSSAPQQQSQAPPKPITLPPGYTYKRASKISSPKPSKATAGGSNTATAIVTKRRSPNLVLTAGLPFILFSVLASWVVSNAYGGKLREYEASQGKTSKSLRQAAMEKEHDEMLERLNKIVATDFDNTKRIKRPEEILEERRKERERRNVWYRRWYRAVVGDNSTAAATTTNKKQ